MNETNYIYEGDTKMALLKEWRDAAYSQEMDQNTLQQFWGTYFEIEKGIYEQLLENPDEEVKGTVKELAEKYGIEVFTMTGFLDGINESLKEENPIEEDDGYEYFDFEAEDNDPNYKDVYVGYDEEEGVFTIEGKQLSKIFRSTNFNDMGSLRYLYKYIEGKGAIEQLKELGLEDQLKL